VLNASDGTERCSVTLKHWPASVAVVGKWLVFSGYEALPHYFFHVASLTDCKIREMGRLAGLRGRLVFHRGQVYAFRKERFHARRLMLRRFDVATGQLVPVEHHPKLVDWGPDESALLGLPQGLLRQHRSVSAGGNGQLTLYDWPPAKTLRWTVPIPGGASVNRNADSQRAQPPAVRVSGSGVPRPARRFIPLLMTGKPPAGQSGTRHRLVLIDLRDGRISWKSKPIVSTHAPWVRLLYRPGIGRPQKLIVLRYRPGGKLVPGLIWVLDGRTGKTLSVLDGAIQFAPWQVAGDRLFGIHPTLPQPVPFAYDLKHREFLLGYDPKSLFASYRARLEQELGPLP